MSSLVARLVIFCLFALLTREMEGAANPSLAEPEVKTEFQMVLPSAVPTEPLGDVPPPRETPPSGYREIPVPSNIQRPIPQTPYPRDINRTLRGNPPALPPRALENTFYNPPQGSPRTHENESFNAPGSSYNRPPGVQNKGDFMNQNLGDFMNQMMPQENPPGPSIYYYNRTVPRNFLRRRGQLPAEGVNTNPAAPDLNSSGFEIYNSTPQRNPLGPGYPPGPLDLHPDRSND